MVIKEVIVVLITEEVYLGLKIPATLNLTIVENVLMVIGDVDICLRSAILPPIGTHTPPHPYSPQ